MNGLICYEQKENVVKQTGMWDEEHECVQNIVVMAEEEETRWG